MMKFYFKKSDIIEYNTNKYVVVSVIVHHGIEYAFANLITEDEMPTDVYLIFKYDNNTIEIEEDMTLMKELTEKFRVLIRKDLEEIGF